MNARILLRRPLQSLRSALLGDLAARASRWSRRIADCGRSQSSLRCEACTSPCRQRDSDPLPLSARSAQRVGLVGRGLLAGLGALLGGWPARLSRRARPFLTHIVSRTALACRRGSPPCSTSCRTRARDRRGEPAAGGARAREITGRVNTVSQNHRRVNHRRGGALDYRTACRRCPLPFAAEWQTVAYPWCPMSCGGAHSSARARPGWGGERRGHRRPACDCGRGL